MSNNIDVSVYILTYFHEKYISQAIESVLSQKTTYRYEIVISDDFSEDGTRALLHEYELKYPDIIHVNYNDKNIGIPNNIFKARLMCRGRYIVLLAGDDYWIDNTKIQKQAEFLDSHEEYIAVCSRLEVRIDNNEKCERVLPPLNEVNKDYSVFDYEKGFDINTHGLMMRNLFLTQEGIDYFSIARTISDKVDDAVDNFLIVNRGKVYTLDAITDVYRVPSSFETSHSYGSKPLIEKIQNDISLYNNMDKIFGSKVNFKNRYVKSTIVIIKNILFSRDRKQWVEIYKMIPTKFRKLNNSVFIACIPVCIKRIIKKSNV